MQQKNIQMGKKLKNKPLVSIICICYNHKRFVEEHIKMARPGVVRGGRRVNLSARVSEKIIKGRVSQPYFGNRIMLDLVLDSIRKKARDVEQGIYIKNHWFSSMLNDKDRSIKGCNFSMLKQDLLAVNGYDERFDQPAYGEDTDLEARLRRNGVMFLGIRNRAIQYHLYHRQLSRDINNKDIYDDNNAKEITYTPFGINQ